MSWNYRVIRHKRGSIEYFAIHEVYYNTKGLPEAVTENGVTPCYDTVKDVKADLRMMHKAFSLPVMDYDEFGEKAVRK